METRLKNLELRDVPEPPPPGKAEVLVGMEYAPINLNDLMVPWGVHGGPSEASGLQTAFL
jgi:NADPH:quinone reductase-like Zn-dependent oxidoreductase